MELKAFLEEHRRLLKTVPFETRWERRQEFMKQYKEMEAKLEAAKTPEQKTKERSDRARLLTKISETLKLRRAKKALKPVNEKAEPVKIEPVKAAPVKSYTIRTAWTAFVDEKGSVKAAAAAKKADSKAYEAFAAKWKKDNS